MSTVAMADFPDLARTAAAVLVLMILSGCAVAPAVREMLGPPMSCEDAAGYTEEGLASWYGRFHQGRPTASGEPFDVRRMTAAHRRLPLGSQVQVVNLENNRETTLKINDRGPFVVDRILDVSERGAEILGFKKGGVVPVKVEVVACGQWVKSKDPEPDDPRATLGSPGAPAAQEAKPSP